VYSATAPTKPSLHEALQGFPRYVVGSKQFSIPFASKFRMIVPQSTLSQIKGFALTHSPFDEQP
jgi:hypothetical protein